MASWKNMEQLLALYESHQALQGEWVKHLLALSVGALAVLSGLQPTANEGMSAYLLASTWFFLGTGIVSGACATFLRVHVAHRLATRFHAQMQQSIEADHPSVEEPVIAKPNIGFSLSPLIMSVSLLLAVCSLVAFSISITLNPV